MEKNKVIIYGVGGVALVGIALYLYNKSKNTTRSGTDLQASENSMVGQMPIIIPTNLPTPSGMVLPVIIPPTGNISGAFSPNPSYSGGFVDDKFTSTPTTSSVPSTSSIPRPSTPSGAGEVVPSTSDVDLFVDPPTTTTPKTSPYSPYVVGSNTYYYGGATLFTNDVNAIVSNTAIPLSQKTTAINVLRQLAIDSIVSNVAVYGNLVTSPLRTSALNSVNTISDSAIAQVQSQLSAIVTGGTRPSTTTTTTTTSSTSSPVLVRGFDGSFSYANGRRMRTRRLFNI